MKILLIESDAALRDGLAHLFQNSCIQSAH